VTRFGLLAIAIAAACPAAASGKLLRSDVTPFPQSKLIIGARWSSPRFAPPTNQWGDILPTVWADDGNQYTMVDDGGTDVQFPGALWRQSVAEITGTPPAIRLSHVGDPNSPPPHTLQQIKQNLSLWTGPLGPYYSSGLLAAGHVLYATQQVDWDWNANSGFTGLAGIAYSFDRGSHWQFANKPFPPPLGNLSWVVRGQGGYFQDGWAYAIATEREFNASTMIMGRARPDVADITNPASWQWVSGWTTENGQLWPQYSSSLASAIPVLSWSSHITYPQMAYDSPIHRYLLVFTYSYYSTPPQVWRNGSELVILDAPHPWGPFSFVARESFFGPANGYAAGFPVAWISRDGRNLWLKFSANFDGCASYLACWAGYGFNYRRIHLTLAGDKNLVQTLPRDLRGTIQRSWKAGPQAHPARRTSSSASSCRCMGARAVLSRSTSG
jgi:hypothetical protein